MLVGKNNMVQTCLAVSWQLASPRLDPVPQFLATDESPQAGTSLRVDVSGKEAQLSVPMPTENNSMQKHYFLRIYLCILELP